MRALATKGGVTIRHVVQNAVLHLFLSSLLIRSSSCLLVSDSPDSYLAGSTMKGLSKCDIIPRLCPNSPVKATGLDTSGTKHSTPPPVLFQSFDLAHQKPLVSRVLFQTRCLGAS